MHRTWRADYTTSFTAVKYAVTPPHATVCPSNCPSHRVRMAAISSGASCVPR